MQGTLPLATTAYSDANACLLIHCVLLAALSLISYGLLEGLQEPVVTLCKAILGRLHWFEVRAMLTGQISGAFLGAGICLNIVDSMANGERMPKADIGRLIGIARLPEGSSLLKAVPLESLGVFLLISGTMLLESRTPAMISRALSPSLMTTMLFSMFFGDLTPVSLLLVRGLVPAVVFGSSLPE